MCITGWMQFPTTPFAEGKIIIQKDCESVSSQPIPVNLVDRFLGALDLLFPDKLIPVAQNGQHLIHQISYFRLGYPVQISEHSGGCIIRIHVFVGDPAQSSSGYPLSTKTLYSSSVLSDAISSLLTNSQDYNTYVTTE